MADVLGAVRPEDEQDWAALEAHLRAVLDVPADPMSVEQFSAGRANLTYRVGFGQVRLVVRRPPRGTLAPGAHDMVREHRVLSRLHDGYRRAPRALHLCEDTSVLGAPFVVIEHRDGVVLRDAVPREMAHHDEVERRVDLALLDAAAELHAVDPAAVGLADLGRSEGFGRRQVDGWRERWRRVAPDDAHPLVDEVAQRLSDTLPTPTRPAIVHNDLKLDNCQYSPDDPDTVTSVFDWDMATVGDPLFDLGLLLAAMSASPLWVVSDDEATMRYAATCGIDVDGIDWYRAFAWWRMAVVLQQLHDRHRRGDSADERHARFGAAVPEVAERAWELIRTTTGGST